MMENDHHDRDHSKERERWDSSATAAAAAATAAATATETATAAATATATETSGDDDEDDDDTWVTLAAMNSPRQYFGACHLDNKIYVAGGVNEDEELYSVEVYDILSNEWNVLPNMHERRSGCACVAFDNQLYVVGGNNGNNNLSTCEVLDLSTQEWSFLPPVMSHPRYGCQAFIKNWFLYVVGGQATSIDIMIEVYDLRKTQTNQWFSMKQKKFVYQAAAMNTQDCRLYVFGQQPCQTNNETAIQILKLNGRTRSQIKARNKKEINEGCGVRAIGNLIYMAGGKDTNCNGSISPFCTIYDTTTQTWLDQTTIPIMPEKRFGCAAVSDGTNLYVLGGYNHDVSYLNKVIRYNVSSITTVYTTQLIQMENTVERRRSRRSRKRNYLQYLRSFMENNDNESYDDSELKREESSSYDDHPHFTNNNLPIQMDNSRLLQNVAYNQNDDNNDDDTKVPSATERVDRLEEGLGSRLDSSDSLKCRIEHLEFNILGDEVLDDFSQFSILKRIKILEEAFYD